MVHCYICNDYVINDSYNTAIDLTRTILRDFQNQTVGESTVRSS